MLGFIVVSIQRRHHNATCDMDWGRSIHVSAFLVFEKVLVSVFDNGIMYCMTTPSVSKFGSSVCHHPPWSEMKISDCFTRFDFDHMV